MRRKMEGKRQKQEEDKVAGDIAGEGRAEDEEGGAEAGGEEEAVGARDGRGGTGAETGKAGGR